MGIFHRTSREEYHTLFISSVYGAFSPKMPIRHFTAAHRFIMETKALSGTTASLKTSLELGRGCAQPLVTQCFSPLATGLDDTVSPERALNMGLNYIAGLWQNEEMFEL